jgi:tetratricopeptide (TPR) repeat protein
MHMTRGPLAMAAVFSLTLALGALDAQTRKPTAPAAKPTPKEDTKPPEPTPIERAEKALDSKNYQEAIDILTPYVAATADDTAAWFDLAFAATALGDKSRAEEAYNKALALDPKLFPAQLNLAVLLTGLGRQKDALPHLAAAVDLKPDHARAAALYASALAATGDRAKAREFYDKSLVLDAAAPFTLIGSGRLAIEEKNYALAAVQLTNAAKLSAADTTPRLELARVYELTSQPDRAVEVYRDFLKENPSFADAHRHLGQIFFEQGKMDLAAPEFEEAARLSPSDEDDWNLARTYSAAKKPDLALPRLVRLRQREPQNYEVQLLTGEMLNLKREYRTAESVLLQAISLQPKIPDAYVELANAMYLQQQYQETVAVLNKMRQTAENIKETPWSTFLQAISLDKLGAAEGAIVSYKRFLAIAGGKYADHEFQARQRVKALTLVLEKAGKKVPQ